MEFVLLAAVAQAAECEDPAVVVDLAVDAALSADIAGARAALARTEAAFTCSGPASPATLARMWVVDGALFTFEGDAASASDSFAAARRSDPTVWIDAFGPDLRTAYDAAPSGVGTGRVALAPPLAAPWILWVDGAPASDLPVGLHLVQVGAEGKAWFAKVIFVSANDTVNLAHGLPATPVVTPPVVVPVATVAVVDPVIPSPPSGAWYAHLGVGADVAFGEALSDAPALDDAEPATKVALPVELGLGFATERAWFRVAPAVAPLVQGHFLYAQDERSESSALALGGSVAGGVTVGTVDLGVSTGVAWPARVTLRALASVAVGPARIEARVGANLPTARAAEPAVGLAVAWTPGRTTP